MHQCNTAVKLQLAKRQNPRSYTVIPPPIPAKRLIVNADDYGMAVGINTGIIEAHRCGIVTSTTVMACGAQLDDGIARLQDTPSLDVGCHLVLVGAALVAPARHVRSLLDGSGWLHRTLPQLLWRLAAGSIRSEEILIEFRAQLIRLHERGLHISHCDTHKHTHAHPRVLDAVLRVVEEFRIPCIRRPFATSPPY